VAASERFNVPTWVEMVLGPFAETKGPRLPGRNPALPSAKVRPQHMEEKKNIRQTKLSTTDLAPCLNC
jgi:hypothetical protein